MPKCATIYVSSPNSSRAEQSRAEQSRAEQSRPMLKISAGKNFHNANFFSSRKFPYYTSYTGFQGGAWAL